MISFLSAGIFGGGLGIVSAWAVVAAVMWAWPAPVPPMPEGPLTCADRGGVEVVIRNYGTACFYKNLILSVRRSEKSSP